MRAAGAVVTRIDLAENEPAGRALSLDSSTVSALNETRLVTVSSTATGQWRLAPVADTIGAVRVGEYDVVVHPKVPFASVLFMLGYAHDPGFASEHFDGAPQAELWPLVAETLVRLATSALLRGVLQGYVTKDDSIALVRGRIRVTDQMAMHPGLMLPLEVRYDEYDVNIPENQILRSALQRMARVPRLSHSLRGRLAHLAARLDGVQVFASGSPLPKWQPTRLNARYQPALQVAEIVLSSLGLGTSAAGQPVSSFVVNMASVFENFLGTALSESFARLGHGWTNLQHRAHLDESRTVGIRPDLVHVRHAKPAVIVDAKYKFVAQGGKVPVSDLYQMHSYCTVLGRSRGYLVYAASRTGAHHRNEVRIRNTDIDVVTWALDVSQRPANLLAQIDALADEAISLAQSSSNAQ